MHFLEWKCLNCEYNFTEIGSLGSHWWYVSIGSGYGVALYRHQEMSWSHIWVSQHQHVKGRLGCKQLWIMGQTDVSTWFYQFRLSCHLPNLKFHSPLLLIVRPIRSQPSSVPRSSQTSTSTTAAVAIRVDIFISPQEEITLAIRWFGASIKLAAWNENTSCIRFYWLYGWLYSLPKGFNYSGCIHIKEWLMHNAKLKWPAHKELWWQGQADGCWSSMGRDFNNLWLLAVEIWWKMQIYILVPE